MTALDSQQLESRLRSALAERLGESRFRLWFGTSVQFEFSDDGRVLSVLTPSVFFREWIQRHYSNTLVEVVELITARHVQPRFTVRDASSTLDGQEHQQNASPCAIGTASTPIVSTNGKASQNRQPDELCTLDQNRHNLSSQSTSCVQVNQLRRGLDSFITGPSNQLAHAAACEMIRTAGSLFNPLLIHGGVGLGKTHLLQAIMTGLQSNHPGLKVIWLTAEAFTNGFLESMRGGSLATFRARHRGAGALALDDAHFLAGTRATQNEFLHTFNALTERVPPIILTTDLHPRHIPKLTQELATRFLGGLVVKLVLQNTQPGRNPPIGMQA